MLHFKSSGHGQPLVLIHGLFGNLDNLASCGRHLEQQGYQVIRIDLANHGESPSQDSVNYSSMAADVLALLDELAVNQCHLIGHSMGGKVAMRLALEHPARVKKLVVADIAPVPYQSHHTQVFKGLDLLWERRPASRTEADSLLSSCIEDVGVRQFLLKNLRFSQGRSEWRLRYPQIKQSYPAILDWPALNLSFSGPTLFVKGERSDYITESSRTAIGRYFPAAKAHIIQGAGHWLHAEKADSFNRVIARFLSRD